MISVSDYHRRTKHSLKGYAKGPETLDWDDQPDPFRHFDGCPTVTLPAPGRELPLTWADLELNRPPAELTLDNVGLLLELAFGLSAWKQYGPDRWALRCNPSSGNLHPSEAYLINGVPGLMAQGVYHYVSVDHHLEQRCRFENPALEDTLLLGLSSVHWREAWKYGERAYRYCQLDAGHAFAALAYAAAVLGWRIEWLGRYADAEIACLLGINSKDDFVAKETEAADWLCRIRYNDTETDADRERIELLQTVQNAVWQGQAKSLGAYHMFHWPIIEQVSQAAQKPRDRFDAQPCSAQLAAASECTVAASSLIRQRRSAQRFNPAAASIPHKAFDRLLGSLAPGNRAPFEAWSQAPN
ncbi:MAG: SagB/ThcOx family dehydrogenase, partial [Gammaproteobacteria bacterium]